MPVMLPLFSVTNLHGAWTILDANGYPVRTYGDRGAAMRDAKRRNDRVRRDAKAAEEAAKRAEDAKREAYYA